MAKFTIDRRQFLAGTAALGLAAALPGAGRAAAPKNGGHFKAAIGDFSSTESLDPALAETRYQLNLNWQIRNNLAEVGPGGVVVPELAESWEGSPDAKQWVFKIRKGVTFHNGKKLTAQDVVYSINLHRKEGTHSFGKPFVAPIEEMKATGELEVTVKLNAGNVGFPELLTHPVFLIVPDGETDFQKGIGTGGYILESFEPGVRSMAKRNPNYWKADRAHFDSVELLAIKDTTARQNALVAGKIQAFNFVDLKTVDLLKQQPGVQILEVAGKAHYTFPMLMDTAPFNDNDVRMAMKLAIDRDEQLKRILNGHGSIGNDQPLSAAYQFFDPNIPQTSYDPDKAKFHLKKAGHSDLSVQLYVSEVPYAGATDASVLYKEQAAKAGINIEVIKSPEDGYWSDVWAKKPFCAARWSGRINADVMIGGVYTGDALKAGWNETHMDDERVNKLVIAARTEFDPAKRAQIYAELQTIIHDEGGAVIPVFADFVDAASDKIAFDKLSSDWDLDGSRASERWWFA